MKPILSVVILTLVMGISLATKAQNFQGHMEACLNTCQIDGDDYAGYDRLGAYLGGLVSYPLSKQLAWQSGVFYSGQGSSSGGNAQGEEYKVTLHYVRVPLRLQYQIPLLPELGLSTGLAASYLLKGEISLGGSVTDSKYSNFNDWDISAVVVASYALNARWEVMGRYNYSILPFRSNPNWFHEVMTYGLRYTFSR